MKTFFLALLFLVTCNNSFSQKFEYYLNNFNIDDYSFSEIEKNSTVNVKFINPSNFKFRITSVTVIITYDNRGQSGGQGSHPGSLKTVRKTVTNTSNLYSSSPSFSFDLYDLISEFRKWRSVSFLVDGLLSNKEEGTSWASRLRFTEAKLTMSIKTDPTMSNKGGN